MLNTSASYSQSVVFRSVLQFHLKQEEFVTVELGEEVRSH